MKIKKKTSIDRIDCFIASLLRDSTSHIHSHIEFNFFTLLIAPNTHRKKSKLRKKMETLDGFQEMRKFTVSGSSDSICYGQLGEFYANQIQ